MCLLPLDFRAEDQFLTDREGCLIFTSNFKAGVGDVTAISGYLAKHNSDTCTLQPFDDESTCNFFMRVVFDYKLIHFQWVIQGKASMLGLCPVTQA